MSGLRKICIQSGGLHVAARPSVITTVLGSCVSVCLFDPDAGVGGMNHFALPESPGGPAGDPYYGDVAMRQLFRGLAHRGGRLSNCVAKLFGGARPNWAAGNDKFEIGARNVAFARAALALENIPVLAERTGGPVGMRVAFESRGGAVEIQVLRAGAPVVPAPARAQRRVSPM